MKKLIIVFLSVLLLTACNSNEVKISEMDSPPKKVKNAIDDSHKLQLINDSKSVYYIVYRSDQAVTADVQLEGDTLHIQLDESEKADGEMLEHVYKVTAKAGHEIIDILLNGESVPTDVVSHT